MLRNHGLNGLQHSHMHIIALCHSQWDFLLSFLCVEGFQKIPIDVEFGVTLPDLSDTNQQNYAQKLKAQLKWAYKKVNEVNLKEATRHKKYYDHKFKCMKLVPGDTVLVRMKGVDRKIRDKWEQQPYVVLEQMSHQPVF